MQREFFKYGFRYTGSMCYQFGGTFELDIEPDGNSASIQFQCNDWMDGVENNNNLIITGTFQYQYGTLISNDDLQIAGIYESKIDQARFDFIYETILSYVRSIKVERLSWKVY